MQIAAPSSLEARFVITVQMFAEAFVILFWLGIIVGVIGLINLLALLGMRRRICRDLSIEFRRWSAKTSHATTTEAMASTVQGLKASLSSSLDERNRFLTHVDALEQELAEIRAQLHDAKMQLQDHKTSSKAPSRSEVKSVDEQAPPKVNPPPRPDERAIVTRTTQANTGVHDEEFVEWAWSEADDKKLLRSYLKTRNIAGTAIELKVDQRQVAARLVRLLLEPDGDIHDQTVENWGKNYKAADTRLMLQMWNEGDGLLAIATELGRDQLGIGWKLLDHSSQPVELSQLEIPKIARFTTFGRP
ncbi:MAG: hypothetical protein RJQ01_04450 [Microcella sp.]|uniref:hypothetical protein n=1 Tax=Microcella sp. TaxID=1913979 RepID=UPI003314F8BF